jgi:hypothetical protein
VAAHHSTITITITITITTVSRCTSNCQSREPAFIFRRRLPGDAADIRHHRITPAGETPLFWPIFRARFWCSKLYWDITQPGIDNMTAND